MTKMCNLNKHGLTTAIKKTTTLLVAFMKSKSVIKVHLGGIVTVIKLLELLASYVVATRFVKCNKCNHFFAVIPDNETKLNVKDAGNDARQQTERRPPPPPRKVCHLFAMRQRNFFYRMFLSNRNF